MIMLKQVNEYLASMPHDTMNDYFPPALWLDLDTGTYGDAKRLAIIDVSQWGDDEIGVWETMTDTERQGYGIDYLEALKVRLHTLNRRPPRQNICGR
jgi:hypothetical protein